MGAIRERLFPPGRPGVDATALESALVYGTIWLGLCLVGYPVYLLTLESGLIDTTDARGLLGSDFVAFWSGARLAALAIGAFRVMDRSPALAGAMLAALAQKPQLGLTIALLLVLHREWRTIGATLAAAAGLVALSLALHGAQPWIDWVEVVLPYQASLMAVTDDYLPHLLMMSTWFVGLRVMFAPEGLAGAVHALGVALTLGFVAFAALRRSRETGRIVALIAAPGVSPYLFVYDLGVLTGALWLALVHRAPRADRSRLLVAGLNLPILSFALASASYILARNFGLQGPILQIGPPIILCLTGWAALRMEPAARPSPLDATQAPAALPLGAQAAA